MTLQTINRRIEQIDKLFDTDLTDWEILKLRFELKKLLKQVDVLERKATIYATR